MQFCRQSFRYFAPSLEAPIRWPFQSTGAIFNSPLMKTWCRLLGTTPIVLSNGRLRMPDYQLLQKQAFSPKAKRENHHPRSWRLIPAPDSRARSPGFMLSNSDMLSSSQCESVGYLLVSTNSQQVLATLPRRRGECCWCRIPKDGEFSETNWEEICLLWKHLRRYSWLLPTLRSQAKLLDPRWPFGLPARCRALLSEWDPPLDRSFGEHICEKKPIDSAVITQFNRIVVPSAPN